MLIVRWLKFDSFYESASKLNALREPGRISKAPLPFGVDSLNTALAQSFLCRKVMKSLALAEYL